MNKFKKRLTSIRPPYCSLFGSYAALVILNVVTISQNKICADDMKRRFKIAIQVCIFLTLSLCSSNPLIAQGPCSNIVGTWEYELENQKGLFMATETHAMWLIVNKDRTPYETWPPTESEKVEAFDGVNASAMTHTCEGNTVTVQYSYSKHPNLTGSSMRWKYEIEGDVLTYRTLNKDGSQRSEGRMRRVKD